MRSDGRSTAANLPPRGTTGRACRAGPDGPAASDVPEAAEDPVEKGLHELGRQIDEAHRSTRGKKGGRGAMPAWTRPCRCPRNGDHAGARWPG